MATELPSLQSSPPSRRKLAAAPCDGSFARTLWRVPTRASEPGTPCCTVGPCAQSVEAHKDGSKLLRREHSGAARRTRDCSLVARLASLACCGAAASAQRALCARLQVALLSQARRAETTRGWSVASSSARLGAPEAGCSTGGASSLPPPYARCTLSHAAQAA